MSLIGLGLCLSVREGRGPKVNCRTRFGPTGIRLGSRRMSKGFNVDSETGFNALDDWATIVDCGDVFLSSLMS